MKMKSRFVLIILTAFGLWQCAKSDTSAPDTGNDKVYVKAVALQPQPFEERIHITGVVKAKSQINVVAEESGTVRNLHVHKGDNIKAGDTLLELSNPVIGASARQALAALKQARLDAESARIMYDKKALSEIDFKRAQLNLERAEAAYKIARTREEKLTPQAPISGIVNRRYVDRGAWVTPGTPLFEIIDFSQSHVLAGVPERFYSFIAPGTKAAIRFDAFPDRVIYSRIRYVSRAINPKNRTFDIEISLPFQQDIPLSPEMAADIEIVKQRTDNGLVVPLDAIIESEKGRFVFVTDGTTARKKQVMLNAINGDSALIEGLQSGDRLIVVGQRQVSDGDSVSVTTD